MTVKDGVPVDRRILKALRRIIRAVEQHSRRLAEAHDLTGPQLICLLEVTAHERIAIGALARQAQFSPSTVVGIVDRLERKGLIERERDHRDRRVVHLVPTRAGRRAARKAPSPLQDRLADALNELSELEQNTIALSLERVVEMMEVGHLDAGPVLSANGIGPGADADPDRGSAPA